MSNIRDNGPELDYYELRRRHEQYKSRARKPVQPTEAAKSSEAVRPVDPIPAGQTVTEPRNSQMPAAFQEKRERQRPKPDFVPEEELDEIVDAGEDDSEAPEDEYENPNPFDSFIRFFHGVKGNISARKRTQDADEDAPEEDAEEAPARRPYERKRPEPDFDVYEADEAGGMGEDIDDVEVDGQPLHSRRGSMDGADEGFDDDFVDDEDEFEDEHRSSGFKRFLNLFVTRVDDADDDEDADEDEYEDAFDDAGEDEDAPDPIAHPAEDSGAIRREPCDIEGGSVEMDEITKPTGDALQEQMAAELETSGMSRRERREHAMRLAAEEAAKLAAAEEAARAAAAEEAAKAAAEQAAVVEEPVPAQDAATPEAEPAAVHPEAEPVDEPTREFKPVSMRDVTPSAAEKLFDLDDEDEDEEDAEEEEPKPRRGLFGRRKKVVDEDEDEDDEDDFDENDEDEDEEEERPVRRGLFGRRKKIVDEDDEDEDDEDEDDEDDFDEDDDDDSFDEDDDEYDDDEYDEYDEDDDDEADEYDEDEDAHRSFGHHVVGVLKSVLGIIIFLLVVVIVLNFVPSFRGVVDTLNDKFGDSKAFHFLFPTYVVSETLTMEDEPTVTAEPTAEPIPVTDVSATAALPDLSQDAAGAQTDAESIAPADAEASIG